MKGFQCYCEADFLGNWNNQFTATDPSTTKSRSGWIVFYAGCPIIWSSKLQSQVTLLTPEVEYITMSIDQQNERSKIRHYVPATLCLLQRF